MPAESYSKVLGDGTVIGSVPGIAPGTHYRDRQQLHDLGLHRGLMRGIAPHGSSVVMSGGYPDDEDLGDVIVYTGEGGRDANTSKQVADQDFTGGNAALAHNHLNGIPVRVHRSSKYAKDIPDGYRYRYDGLYRVAATWREVGRDGFKICRFRLEKIRDSDVDVFPPPEPPPGTVPPPAGNRAPASTVSRVTRTIRDTDVSDYVKRLYNHTCQICSTRLVTPRGPYSEGCHVKPLGRPHRGPDVPANVLCLCPNCHVLFDEVAIWVDDDLTIRGARQGKLTVKESHQIDVECLRYHREMGR